MSDKEWKAMYELAIEQRSQARSESARLRAERDALRAECDAWKNEAMLMGAHQGIDNHQRLLARAEKAAAERDALRAPTAEFVRDYENGDMSDLKHYARAMRAALKEAK